MFYLICLALIAAALALMSVPALKGWRTMIFNGAVVAIGGLAPILVDSIGFLNGLDWTKYVSEGAVPWVMLALGLGGIVLRYLTSGPVGKKP